MSLTPPPVDALLPRVVPLERVTRETHVSLELNLDGTGQVSVATGVGFLDHLLTALAMHARFDLRLRCDGDTHIDDHHTAEDCALALGEALLLALGDKRGITRFGTGYAPLDEALARAVVDLSGRPLPVIHLELKREAIGQLACENMTHVLQSLATAAKMALHVDVLRGDNDHHKVEAAFKATALALRQAVHRDGSTHVPSTKGSL